MNVQYQNDYDHQSYKKPRKIAFVNIGIVIVNILVFLLLDYIGNTEDPVFMAHVGAIFPPFVVDQKEYYRLFTGMFLHFGINHLVNNMLVLFFLGDNLERAVGHVRYLIIYLLSGLGAGSLSVYMMIQSGDYAVSAGASGAIFGMVGALLYIVIRNKGRLEGVTTKRLGFMILLSLYLGFSSTGVDNMAHVGGLISGFLLAVLLYHKKKKVEPGWNQYPW
ncbi:MAG: rhomboid family intramembrane serine protease [Lachnospiraceae bacterium]|mgnify:FL=1|jgi:rhomboid protease GluP|nr:rhomboid family intramembrane serine protease [Lachnospiraceae bacterium]